MEIIWKKIMDNEAPERELDGITFQEALKVFVDSLNDDGGLWIAYQSNIAMAFYDAVNQNPGMDLHGVSNLVSINFLKMLGVKRIKP